MIPNNTIAAITFTITLFAIVYKYGQHVGEMKEIKEVINAKLESINEKYNTSEKIQKVELDIGRLNIESNANKECIKEYDYEIVNLIYDKSSALEARCEKLESRIKSLDDEMKTHKEVYPPAYKSSAD